MSGKIIPEPVPLVEVSERSLEDDGPVNKESTKSTFTSYGFPEHPPGTTETVKELAETADDAIKRTLVEGEKIVSQFNCYFPGDMIPVWKLVMLSVCTLGLYGIVLLYRFIKRQCYSRGCCTPNMIQFEKKRMAITDKGRVILWTELVSQKIQQKGGGGSCLTFCCTCVFSFFWKIIVACVTLCDKDLCRPPTEYSVVTNICVYGASQICQVSQYYESKAAFLCFCVEYECGVEVVIDEYNYDPFSSSATTSQYPPSSYYMSLSGLVNSALKVGEAFMGFQAHVIRINSNTFDRIHNGDIHAVLDDLAQLQSSIINCIKNTPDVFLSNNEIEKGKNSKYSVDDGFVGVTIVQDDRTVQIPKRLLNIQPNEEVLYTNGEVYIMTFMDWVRTILSCGRYYCKEISPKKYDRSALIITNKRIIDVDIFHRAGEIPSHLANVSIKSRSFYPHKVLGGYISGGMQSLTVGLNTVPGTLKFHFPSGLDALPFAKALQMSTIRKDATLALEEGSIKKGVSSKLDSFDKNLLPLLEGEKLVSSIEGEETWLPYCKSKSCLRFVNWWRSRCCGPCELCCDCSPVSNACSKEACYCCFPILPYLTSCFLRPFRANDDILLTKTSILRYTRSGNSGICGYADYCLTKDNFLVSWIPITELVGQSLKVTAEGRETWFRRCFKCMPFSSICCPIGVAEYIYTIDLRKVDFSITSSGKDKNFHKDAKLIELRDMISDLQIFIEDKHANSASKV